MSSEETIREIEKRRWKYVLGVRMRRSREVRDEVLSQPGRYQQVFGKSKDSKENRLEQMGLPVEWADVLRDLDNLVEMEIKVSSDKRYTIRSQTAGTVAKVFGACGVALPPMLSQG